MFEKYLGGELFILALDIYKDIVNLGLPTTWAHYNQITRSSASICANISESKGRRTDDKYSGFFLAVSNGSAIETLAWLEIGYFEKLIAGTTLQTLGEKILVLSQKLKDEIVRSGYIKKKRNDDEESGTTI